MRLAWIVPLCLALAACTAAMPPAPPRAPAAPALEPAVLVPPPKPRFEQTGIASWYGSWHHGRTMANGQRFDMNALSAAHRTLPFGSRVRVTNLDNGRTVELPITDRGPYRRGRVIDLSRKAAEALGMKEDGLAQVRIELLETGN